MRQMFVSSLTIGATITMAEGSWLAAGLALAIAMACAVGFRQLRGTTLAAPAVWGIVSALTIAVVEARLAWRSGLVDPLAASLWRYTAAVGTFCPLMAVLGAKRPQDRGWQWVVLALWVVLLVPVGQALAAKSGARLELFGAWRLLLVALLAMGLLNYLPTRYAIAALLFALGQTLLLGPVLLDAPAAHEWVRSGLMAVFAAMSAVGIVSAQKGRIARDNLAGLSALQRFTERWFAFRDSWGAFWGLRVLQRVNQTAELSHWPVRLHWLTGFQPHEDRPLDAKTSVHLKQTLDSVLRRFERVDAPP